MLFLTWGISKAESESESEVVSDSLWPRGLQPTRLLRPWDSPGKSTGVGCHFLLQCMKVKSESEVAQSCPTLHDPMACCLPGFSVHGILQARVLEWGAIAFSFKAEGVGYCNIYLPVCLQIHYGPSLALHQTGMTSQTLFLPRLG